MYLSPELTLQFFFFDDFKERHPEIKVSYDRYKNEVTRLNISFVKLGEEKREDCIMYKNHEQGNIEERKACKTCDSWKAHLERAKGSRKLYKEDAELESTPSKAYFSVDM